MNSRGITHTLHATGGNNTAIAGSNALRGEDNRFHPTGTNFVDCGGIGAGLQPSTEGNLTCRGLAYTSLDNIAKVDLLNNSGINFLGL